MASTSVDLTSRQGRAAIETKLSEDFEALPKDHKTLQIQYGEAKITSGRELLRLILLHVGTDLGLRQTVALMADSSGPNVGHVTLHKQMRLAPLTVCCTAGEVPHGGRKQPRVWTCECGTSAAPLRRVDEAASGERH